MVFGSSNSAFSAQKAISLHSRSCSRRQKPLIVLPVGAQGVSAKHWMDPFW